jgi:hypothetical protein
MTFFLPILLLFWHQISFGDSACLRALQDGPITASRPISGGSGNWNEEFFAATARAAAKGITYVIRGSIPNSNDFVGRLYGHIEILRDEDILAGGKRMHRPGLVVFWGTTEKMRDWITGDLVLAPKTGLSHSLSGDKWVEYKFVSQFDPSIMPRTVNAESIVNPRQENREIARELNLPVPFRRNGMADILESFFKKFMDTVLAKFPMGAHIKLIDDYQTGDNGRIMSTYNFGEFIASSAIRNFMRGKRFSGRSDRN